MAAALGLPGVIAHGMLTMASAVRVVTDWLDDPADLVEYGVRFTKPVVVPDDDKGASVTFSAKVDKVARRAGRDRHHRDRRRGEGPRPVQGGRARPVRTHVRLADFTTLRIGGPADKLVEVSTEDDLITAVRDADAAGEPVLLLSGGSNVVIGDDGFRGTVIKIATRGIRVDADMCSGAMVHIQAGEDWDAVVQRAIAEEWSGLESMSGIPGLTGSTPVQNVGAYGHEVAETIASVRVWDRVDNQVRTIFAADCGFSYRNSRFKADPSRYVVLEVAFQLKLGDLSAPVGYAELARVLDVEPGSRAPMTDVREAVLGLRRSKGMVLDPADHDTWSAGLLLHQPHPRHPRRGPRRRAAVAPARRPRQNQRRLADRTRRHLQGLRHRQRRRLHQTHPRPHQPRHRHRQGTPRPGRPRPHPGPPGLRHHPGQRTSPGELQPLMRTEERVVVPFLRRVRTRRQACAPAVPVGDYYPSFGTLWITSAGTRRGGQDVGWRPSSRCWSGWAAGPRPPSWSGDVPAVAGGGVRRGDVERLTRGIYGLPGSRRRTWRRPSPTTGSSRIRVRPPAGSCRCSSSPPKPHITLADEPQCPARSACGLALGAPSRRLTCARADLVAANSPGLCPDPAVRRGARGGRRRALRRSADPRGAEAAARSAMSGLGSAECGAGRGGRQRARRELPRVDAAEPAGDRPASTVSSRRWWSRPGSSVCESTWDIGRRASLWRPRATSSTARPELRRRLPSVRRTRRGRLARPPVHLSAGLR